MTDLATITARTPLLVDEMRGGKPDETLWHHSVSPYDGYVSERILATGEQQVYVDPAMFGRSQLFPVGDTCVIMAQPMDAGMRKLVDQKMAAQSSMAASLKSALTKADYVSACLSSRQAFQFGYVEASMALGANPAGWPAFWLYNRTHGLEIDALEYKGADGVMRCHVHAGAVTGLTAPIVKPSGWHAYGALWTSGRVEFFLDRKSVGVLTYDPKYDGPAYMILNLAVGGWAPKPLPNPKDAIKIQVDRVAWWALPA